MGTKMKGVLKGLRYITQIFEDEKEPEIQIGFPTDVKHVAHIGWDGPSPSVDNSPSWMKEYKTSGPQTASEEGKENPDLRWGSQDSLSQRGSGPQARPHRDLPDLPKSSRRHSLADVSSTSSPKGSKSRQSRRTSLDSSKSSRKQKDTNPGSESPSRNLPGLPKKKSSRKKSKESLTGGSSKSRKKDVTPSDSCPSPFSDPGQDNESMSEYDINRLVHSLSLGPDEKEEKW